MAARCTSDGSHYEKRGKGEPVCIDDEIPFEIPESWVWCRYSTVADTLAGFAFKSSDFKPTGRFRLLRGINLGVNQVRWSDTVCVDDIPSNAAIYKLKTGDVLLGLDRPWITGGLRAAIIEEAEDTYLVQRVLRIRQTLAANAQWLLLLLTTPLLSNVVAKDMTGISVPHISENQVTSILVPLPPINEQRRITDCVARIMPIVDDYGALEEARERLDAELPDRLRKSVLQLAVQGRLVEQDPADEPASALLDRIRAERASLVKEGKLKAAKGGESVIYRASDGGYYEKRGKGEPQPLEVPFEIPEGWEWARLGSVASIAGGATPDKGNPSFWNGGIPWASVKDLKGDRLESTIDTISEAGLASKTSISQCTDGDLIVATRLVPGKSIICRMDCTINQDLKRIRTMLDIEYVHIWFQSERPKLHMLGQGTTVPGIKVKDLEDALIPVPPKVEQHRIVTAYAVASQSLTNQ